MEIYLFCTVSRAFSFSRAIIYVPHRSEGNAEGAREEHGHGAAVVGIQQDEEVPVDRNAISLCKRRP